MWPCRALAALLLLCLAAGPAAGADSGYVELEFGGEARRYFLHLPETLPAGPVPLVLVLHGAGGSGDQAVERYGWAAKADTAGFIAAGPEALPVNPDRRAGFLLNPRVWNDGSDRGPAATLARDDTGYLAAVIADISHRRDVDAGRVFVTGFSNGASMTHRFGTERADLVAAIAPYAGALWPREERLLRALPVLYLTGDADPLNPIAGGELSTPWGAGKPKPPVRETLDTWAAWLGCTPQPQPAPRPVQAVALQTWSGCRGDGALVYAEIAGVGHHWAGAGDSELPERWVGPYVDTGFDATDFIWDFFTAAPRPPR